MTRLDLFLSLEGPELDRDRADHNVVSDWIILKGTQDVFRPVGHSINDGLNAFVALGIPNLDDLVSSKTDQVVPVFIDIQVTHRRVMPIQIGQLLESVGLPEDDMTLFTTTSDLLVLDRVDETVDTLLMKIESSFLLIVKRFKLMHVDEAIERGGQEHVQVLIILDLGDPTPMSVHLQTAEAFLAASILRCSLVLLLLASLLNLRLLIQHLVAVLRLFELATLLAFLALGCLTSLSRCTLACSSTCTLRLRVTVVNNATTTVLHQLG